MAKRLGSPQHAVDEDTGAAEAKVRTSDVHLRSAAQNNHKTKMKTTDYAFQLTQLEDSWWFG